MLITKDIVTKGRSTKKYKILPLAIGTLALMLVLTGCGNGGAKSTTDKASTNTPSAGGQTTAIEPTPTVATTPATSGNSSVSTPTPAPSSQPAPVVTPKATPAPTQPTPKPAPPVPAPATSNSTEIAQGQTLFSQKCQACHGANATGGAGPALKNYISSSNQAGVATFISSQMPPGSSHVSASEAAAVTAYLFHLFGK